jgi:chitinase
VSSIHFGINDDGSLYIHLNDYPPDDKRYDLVWKQLKEASDLGIEIVLMVGGAGGGFTQLFDNYREYYKLLKKTILDYPFISGIDLDIEETTNLNDVKKIISQINIDFGKDFIISMAPVSSSLEDDYPGMGGFNYKELYNSLEGKRINYFNTQFYYDFVEASYDKVIQNGYPANKIVLGMLSQRDINVSTKIVYNLKEKYMGFGGVYNWEYFDSPPGGEKNPYLWALEMKKAMYRSLSMIDFVKGIVSYLLTK